MPVRPKKRPKSSSYPQWDGLPVEHLIHATADFIVFLDEELEVDWKTSEKYDAEGRSPTDFGVLQSRYTALEGLIVDGVSKSTRKHAERMLAESADRGLSGDVASGHKILDEAETFIHARNQEVGRLRYLYAAVCCAVPIAILVFAVWLFRSTLEPLLGNVPFTLVLCGGAGSVGALLLVLRNAKGVLPDPQANARLHQAEAVARVLAGGLGAVLAALAVKAGVLFPQLNTISEGSYIIFLASFAAGASERLVPDMVGKLETKGDTLKPKI